jgi:uncharacterized protein (TIGR02246 family)
MACAANEESKPVENSFETELESVNQRWVGAWLARDPEEVDAMMAPGYVYVAPDGRVMSRKAIMEIVESPEYALSWGGRSEVSVSRITPDLAMVVCRWRGEGMYRGRRFRDDQRCSSLFVKRAGTWLVAHEHSSTLASSEWL